MEAGAFVARERLQRRGVRLEWFTVAWNLAEALVAIAAGVAAGSIALIGFGVDSGIEVVAASALLWRFRHARADASEAEHGLAERRALYVVSATFFASPPTSPSRRSRGWPRGTNQRARRSA